MTQPTGGASNIDWRRITKGMTISAYVPGNVGTEGADSSACAPGEPEEDEPLFGTHARETWRALVGRSPK